MRSLCTIWIFVELNFYDYKVEKEVFMGPHCLDKLEDGLVVHSYLPGSFVPPWGTKDSEGSLG